jgi:hypothetical protein
MNEHTTTGARGGTSTDKFAANSKVAGSGLIKLPAPFCIVVEAMIVLALSERTVPPEQDHNKSATGIK